MEGGGGRREAARPHRRVQLPARGRRKAAAVGRDRRDAGPPVREVMRLGEEQPDILQGREQLAGLRVGGHSVVLAEAEQVADALAEQADEVAQAR